MQELACHGHWGWPERWPHGLGDLCFNDHLPLCGTYSCSVVVRCVFPPGVAVTFQSHVHFFAAPWCYELHALYCCHWFTTCVPQNKLSTSTHNSPTHECTRNQTHKYKTARHPTNTLIQWQCGFLLLCWIQAWFNKVSQTINIPLWNIGTCRQPAKWYAWNANIGHMKKPRRTSGEITTKKNSYMW